MRTRKHFKVILISICLLFSACDFGQSNQNKVTDLKKSPENTAAPDISNILKKQILLTNDAQFTDGRTLEGASGFLIKYNDANFAVTVRHLLGEAGGVEPEVKINDLSKSLTNWEMMPRIVGNKDTETVKVSAAGLDFSQSAADIILLKVTSKSFTIETLTPNFDIPQVGETLFLIGCPYSEKQCKQNSYPVRFAEFDEQENALVCEMDAKVELSGFSGAPLINGKGEVLGALVSGGAAGGKNYVVATHIKEIQKIKF